MNGGITQATRFFSIQDPLLTKECPRIMFIPPHAFSRRPRLAIILGLALAFWALALPAQDLRQTGKDLKANFGDAIANVKIVLDPQSGGSGGNSIQGETCGTVISPEGLVIIPLFAIDPAQIIKRMVGPMGDTLPLDFQVHDIKIGFGKQAPLPATVVLRDADLGLALLRPREKPAAPVKFIDLSKAAVDPEALDPLIIMTRLGNVAGREVALLSSSIQAVVSRPRKFFVPTGGFAGFGVPAFAADGKIVGVCMLQTSMGGMQDMESGIFSLNLSHIGVLPIIMPASQIKDLAAQAPEKPEATPTPAAVEKPAKGLDLLKMEPGKAPAADARATSRTATQK